MGEIKLSDQKTVYLQVKGSAFEKVVCFYYLFVDFN